jgi:2-aminoethylphosphonate-pyruvate transaminase
MPVSQHERIDPQAVAAALEADPSISHVGVVYSETSSGLIHDVAAIGAVARAAGRRTIIDAISAFGALPIDMSAMPEADAVIFTSNKCLEGLPGLGFLVARIDRLERCAGNAESWSFDIADMYAGAVAHGWGAFRFTPPAQVLNAARVALDLLDAEGGPAARLKRYTANMRVLHDGMRGIGLEPCLPAGLQGPIVMNVHAPAAPGWDLRSYVERLKARGVLISNFGCTDFPSMRIGAIGALTPSDMDWALGRMADALGRKAA